MAVRKSAATSWVAPDGFGRVIDRWFSLLVLSYLTTSSWLSDTHEVWPSLIWRANNLGTADLP